MWHTHTAFVSPAREGIHLFSSPFLNLGAHAMMPELRCPADECHLMMEFEVDPCKRKGDNLACPNAQHWTAAAFDNVRFSGGFPLRQQL